ATSSLMLQVETASRLERYLRGCSTPVDADALEEELLRAVCGRSDEWGDAVASADAGTLAARLAGYDTALADWAPLRLRALAAGACVLSGVKLGVLGLPDATAAVQTARTDLPRLLGFLARRATERREPLPHVALAAEDLSLSLRAALPQRGQAVGLATLADARLVVRGRILCLAGVPEATRCWVRLSASADDYALVPTLTAGATPLASLTSLGTPGAGTTIWATVVTREKVQWSHAVLSLAIQIPAQKDGGRALTPCRQGWKVLGAYTHPAARRLPLARYLATAGASGGKAAARPKRRPPTPDPSAGPCPTCGGAMARRKSTRGDFFGCIRYPQCRGTREA
ncbi:MAG: Topoisomerase binding zinc finger, partial [Chloroflexi bacterium]|nr:Topoisomerase binding zinc finger [Chloroflexota bacterium]